MLKWDRSIWKTAFSVYRIVPRVKDRGLVFIFVLAPSKKNIWVVPVRLMNSKIVSKSTILYSSFSCEMISPIESERISHIFPCKNETWSRVRKKWKTMWQSSFAQDYTKPPLKWREPSCFPLISWLKNFVHTWEDVLVPILHWFWDPYFSWGHNYFNDLKNMENWLRMLER